MRLVFISIFMLLSGCSKSIDQAKYLNLYRAGKAVQSATQVGISYLEFSRLLQSFAFEISAAEGLAKTDAEQRMVALYHDALKAYQDSQSLWEAQIQNDGRGVKGRGVIIETGSYTYPGGAELVKKYNIPVTDTPIETRLVLDAFRYPWIFAATQLTAADSIYTR